MWALYIKAYVNNDVYQTRVQYENLQLKISAVTLQVFVVFIAAVTQIYTALFHLALDGKARILCLRGMKQRKSECCRVYPLNCMFHIPVRYVLIDSWVMWTAYVSVGRMKVEDTESELVTTGKQEALPTSRYSPGFDQKKPKAVAKNLSWHSW
jgi:hypothetical protein